MTDEEKMEFKKKFLKDLENQKKESDFDSYKKYIRLPIKDWPKIQTD